IPDSPGVLLTVTPENRSDMAARLRIVAGFSLISFSPASGAINVPADIWPSWSFNRAINPDDLTNANFKLTRILDQSIVPVTIRRSETGKHVWLEINGALPLLETFEMRLSKDVRDIANTPLGKPLTTRFITQPPPPPPTSIISLKNYETAAYATETMAVANNDSLYLELVADDTSFSTYETARVRVESSDPSLDGLELVLIENAPPSGVYRLAMPIDVSPGTSMKITSQVSPSFSITVIARTRTLLTAIDPASGTSGLFLDQPLTMTFSASIDRNTTTAGLHVKTSPDLNIPLSMQFADSDRRIIIVPVASYALGARHLLEISTSLRDTNGLFLLAQAAELTTRGEASASFAMQTGLAPRDGQQVAVTGEAVRGSISVTASSTDLLLATNEQRRLRFDAGNQTLELILSETSPGIFAGSADLSSLSADQARATMLFANQPVMNFGLATVPLLLSIYPASGSSGIGEFPEFSAAFSRKMAFESGQLALKIGVPDGILPASPTGTATDSAILTWQAAAALPAEASCSLVLSGLFDYLGQPVGQYGHNFSTGGLQGINLYSDSGFAQLIATSEISLSELFVEIAASTTRNLAGRSFFLGARRGTRATETLQLPVEPVSVTSGIFRCNLAILAGKGMPRHSVGLYPGEWLELTSPTLTDASRLLYFKHAQSIGPQNIKDLRFYSEKDYAQQLSG
ncbi:MAG TPA: Ig-like domain-containing protein, partial [Candidatus Rifleibacterium sp.]|nr:Ig-like domain-containing protein [Candidatus Rifleibacterium sp.]